MRTYCLTNAAAMLIFRSVLIQTLIAALCCTVASAMNFGPVADSVRKSDTTRIHTVPAMVVTTTKAVERQMPVVFNDITRKDLERTQIITDIPKMLSDLPSTTFYSENGNAIGYTSLSMRGFDQRRIAVLINGIPQNDPEDHNVYWINFPDLGANLDNIQVQRGAGLINYGAAAIGGSVNMTTSNFVNNQFVRLTTGIGWQQGLPVAQNTVDPFDRSVQPALAKYSMEFSSGYMNGFALYGRISKIQSQGYRDHSYSDLTSWFFSAASFSDNLSTQINIFGGPIQDGLAYTGLPREWAMDKDLRRSNLNDFGYDSTGRTLAYTSTRRAQEIENFSQPHFEVLNDWVLNDSLTFKSSLFYYTGEGFFDYDAAWAPGSMFGLADSVVISNALVRANVDNRQVGWIPRMVWTNALGVLTAGLELRLHRSESWGKIRYAEGLPPGFDPDYKFYNYQGERHIFSAFARQLWHATDEISVTAELQAVTHRYGLTNESKNGVFTQYATTSGEVVGNGGDLFNVHYTFLNPRAGVNFNIDDNQSALLSLAYTSREPRRNNLYAASDAWYSGGTPLFRVDTVGGVVRYDFSDPIIKPETMLDFEMQYSWRSAALTVSATVYFMDFRNELVKNGQRDIFGVPVEGNAPHTRHVGIELQAAYALIDNINNNLTLWGNLSISRNRIVDWKFATTGGDSTDINLVDKPIAGFPDLVGNVGVRATLGGFKADLVGKYIGEFFTNSFGDVASADTAYQRRVLSSVGYLDNRVDAAFVVNAVVAYEFKDLGMFSALRLKAMVNNVTNNLYIQGGNGKEFFPAAERNVLIVAEVEL